jgi:hypothetical protein
MDQNDRKDSAAGGEETNIYLTGDSTLQTPEEAAKDKSKDTREDTTMEVSADDLHETAADRLAGSDRAGTAERKDNSNSDNNE